MFDGDRQIRFLYPPVFFLVSLLVGIRLDDEVSFAAVATTVLGKGAYELLRDSADTWSALTVSIVTASGLVLTILVGYLLSSFDILIVRLIFGLFGCPPYEAALRPASFRRLRDILQLPANKKGRDPDALYLSATFDHEILPDGIHTWIQRRWSMFYLALHSTVALVLSVLVGYYVFAIENLGWSLAVLFCCGGLSILTYQNWSTTMGMLEFQTRLPRRSVSNAKVDRR